MPNKLQVLLPPKYEEAIRQGEVNPPPYSAWELELFSIVSRTESVLV